MGWKASFIIINKPTQVNHLEIIKELGFNKITEVGEDSFDEVMNPKDESIYIGSYNDNLIICIQDLPLHFLEEGVSKTEVILQKIFPNSEICAIVLHSVVNLWGYAVWKNGEKIRVRAGSSEEGTYIELGEPLEEEKELLSKSFLDNDGVRMYQMDGFSDRPFSEDQVGENFVFSVCARYLGEELDVLDEFLDETVFSGYRFGKVLQNDEEIQDDNSKPTAKPWWKFWV